MILLKFEARGAPSSEKTNKSFKCASDSRLPYLYSWDIFRKVIVQMDGKGGKLYTMGNRVMCTLFAGKMV